MLPKGPDILIESVSKTGQVRLFPRKSSVAVYPGKKKNRFAAKTQDTLRAAIMDAATRISGRKNKRVKHILFSKSEREKSLDF